MKAPVLARTPVLVTRSRSQASKLSARLREHGAEPVEIPAIRIEAASPEPIDAALERVRSGDYDWVIFTSTNGVRFTLERCADPRAAFSRCRIATVGPKTAALLEAASVTVELIPERAVSEGLLEALRAEAELEGTRVLLMIAEHTREVLPAGLRESGAAVERVTVYRTGPAVDRRDALLEVLGGTPGYVTFASSSSVGHLVAMAGGAEPFAGWRVACIGPITAGAAREAGLTVEVVPETSSIEALVGAILEDARRRP